MNYITTKGFILRVIPYRENNIILDILTADYGLIVCSVKQVRRKNGTLKQACNPFVFGEFELFYYRNRYQLNSLEIIESFSPLSEDLQRLTCLSHLAELVMDILRHQPKANKVYPFWAYAAYGIVYQADPILKTYLAQLKFVADQGFSPWLENCLICHGPLPTKIVYFYLEKGGVICDKANCRQHGGDSSVILLHAKNIAAISCLLRLPYEKCFNITIERNLCDEFMLFSKRYVCQVMEKEYKKLEMLKAMEKLEKGIYE